MNTHIRNLLRSLRLPGTIDTLLREALDSRANVEAVESTSHGFSLGDVVYDNSGWALADADSESSLAQGIVSRVLSVNEFEVTRSGMIRGLTGLTANTVYYLSTTAGSMTSTKPTSGIRQELGRAISTTTFLLNIKEAYNPTEREFPVSSFTGFYDSTAPAGWLFLNGDTIGDVGSGATHTGAQYETLFNIVKNEPPNTGSEDWASGDTVTLPTVTDNIIKF